MRSPSRARHAGGMDTTYAPHPLRLNRRVVTAVAALVPMLAYAACVWAALFAVHNLKTRKGADPTGLAFGEFFVWLVAAGLAVPVLIVLAALLLTKATRTDPARVVTVLGAVVALVGSALARVAWGMVHDSEFVRPISTSWAEPYVLGGLVAAWLPVALGSVLLLARRWATTARPHVD